MLGAFFGARETGPPSRSTSHLPTVSPPAFCQRRSVELAKAQAKSVTLKKTSKSTHQNDLKDLNQNLKDESTKGLGSAAILCTEGLDLIRKEAWSFYTKISGVCLSWELEEPKGPKGPPPTILGPSCNCRAFLWRQCVVPSVFFKGAFELPLYCCTWLWRLPAAGACRCSHSESRGQSFLGRYTSKKRR